MPPRDDIVRAAEDLREEILAISRDLHAHPELSLEERRSSDRLTSALEAAGYAIERGVAGLPTSFVARKTGSPGGPRVAVLAEYDALPVIGHGCGHNLIAAAGVGAGLVLSRLAALPGEILVVGTPAEETIGGKCVMVREGVFHGIDAALMVHGGAEWRVFTDSLACASIEVTYLGRESHAAAWPEKGINALDALIQLFVGLDMMKKRLGPDVRAPGIIREGGTRANIVPARAVGVFSLRAPTAARRDEVRSEVERLARSIAEGTGCQVEIRPNDEPYDEMLTNRALAERFRAHLGSLGASTVDGPRRNKGSIDMGNVSRVVPSVHAFMRIAPPETPIHTAAFAAATLTPEAEASLMIAVKALALTAHDALSDAKLLGDARSELAAALGGTPS